MYEYTPPQNKKAALECFPMRLTILTPMLSSADFPRSSASIIVGILAYAFGRHCACVCIPTFPVSQWPAYAAEHKLLHVQLRVKPRTPQTAGLTGFPNHRACRRSGSHHG